MNRIKDFEFLEHTADSYVAAYGKDLVEAFKNAALATFEVMTDVEKVEAKVEDSIEVEGEDQYALLYNWLETLIVKSEVNEMLFCKFEISGIERASGRLRLKAKVWGEKFDSKKHPQKVGVKAVTYHRMEIIEEQGETTLRFILDI